MCKGKKFLKNRCTPCAGSVMLCPLIVECDKGERTSVEAQPVEYDPRCVVGGSRCPAVQVSVIVTKHFDGLVCRRRGHLAGSSFTELEGFWDNFRCHGRCYTQLLRNIRVASRQLSKSPQSVLENFVLISSDQILMVQGPSAQPPLRARVLKNRCNKY